MFFIKYIKKVLRFFIYIYILIKETTKDYLVYIIPRNKFRIIRDSENYNLTFKMSIFKIASFFYDLKL